MIMLLLYFLSLSLLNAVHAQERGSIINVNRLGVTKVPKSNLYTEIDSITYLTDPGNGNSILKPATALVFTPLNLVQSNSNLYFLVFYAHQTVGTVCDCAISKNGTLENKMENVPSLVDWIALGITVVEPDYYGFVCPEIQPYLVIEAVAASIIDSIRAIRNWKPGTYSNSFAGYGWSQGGHAVLATQGHMNSAPELQMLSAAAIAPPTNLSALIDFNLHSHAGRYLTVLGIFSWPSYYSELTMSQIVKTSMIPTVSRIAQLCVLEPSPEKNIKFLPLLSLRNNMKWLVYPSPTQNPLWAQRLYQNSPPPLIGPVQELLVFQGKKDDLIDWHVTSNWVRETVENVANSHASLQFYLTEDNTHNSIQSVAMPIIIDKFVEAFQKLTMA